MKIYKCETLEEYKNFLEEITNGELPVYIFGSIDNRSDVFLVCSEIISENTIETEIEKFLEKNESDLIENDDDPVFEDDDDDIMFLLM